jgi:hypothetical protein
MSQRAIITAAAALIVLLLSATSVTAQQPSAAARAGAAQGERAQTWSIPDYGRLALTLPPGWAAAPDVPRPDADLPSIIMLAPREGHMNLIVAPVLPRLNRNAPRPDQVRPLIDKMIATVREKDPSQNPRPREFKGPAASGCVFTVARGGDKPGPLGFKFVTLGFVTTGDLVLHVRMGSDAADSPLHDQAIEILKTARLRPDPAAATRRAPEFRLPDASGKWELVVTAPGFEKIAVRREQKSRELIATNERDEMNLSVFLEPAARGGEDATVARDFYLARLKQSPLPMENLKTAGDAKSATTAYTIAGTNQKSVNLYLVHAGTWIDVHLSKTDFKPADQAQLDQILKSVRVEPTRPAATTHQSAR